MHPRQQVPPGLLMLAAEQSGVVTRQQSLGLGLGKKALSRMLADGRWTILERGIYLVPGIEPEWRTRVWAGLLMGGPHARAAGVTAAALHGLAEEGTLPVEILVPNGAKLTGRDWVCFVQERDGVRDRSSRTEPPRTRVEDTVLDLCARGSESACVAWVTAAVQRRLTTPAALATAMRRRKRIPHRTLVLRLLADVASGVHSPLEHRYLYDVERAHGLARGQRQRQHPSRKEFVDVLYDEFNLVVELDGRLGHIGEGRFRDLRRDNRNTRIGVRSLRYGWQDVNQDPCGVAAEVADLLCALGWTGYPSRCPRCLG